MSKKTCNLIVGIVGGLSTIAVAVVTFILIRLQSMHLSELHLLPQSKLSDSL